MLFPKPSWLTRAIPSGRAYSLTRAILDRAGTHTVCRESGCPNLGECFSSGVGTFLILGNRCARGCRYCGIERGYPSAIDPDEPLAVARTVRTLGLRHVVITSVTRDDLPDGGAEHFTATIAAIRAISPETRIEVLIPDFNGSALSVRMLADAHPDVIAHNLDTVPSLFPSIRPNADYRRSLDLLLRSGELAPLAAIKSGLMLGLGETDREIDAVLHDLLAVNCRRIVLGQYLQPSRENAPVRRFVSPGEFDAWNRIALGMGFERAVCAPLARSSYHAGEEEKLATDEHR